MIAETVISPEVQLERCFLQSRVCSSASVSFFFTELYLLVRVHSALSLHRTFSSRAGLPASANNSIFNHLSQWSVFS